MEELILASEHPESLDNVKEIKVTEKIKERITALSSDIEEAKNQRGLWERRQDDYYRKRYGVRKQRNFPWPGYPNYILPLIDSDIAQAKPSYVNAAYGVYPIVTYDPFGPEDIEPARKREALLDYRIKNKMNFFEPYVIGIDKMLQTGFVVFKIIWKFSSRKYTEFIDLEEFDPNVLNVLYDEITTDPMLKKILQEEYGVDLDFEENDEELDRVVAEFREGKTSFELCLLEKEHNEPELIVCDPKDDIVVPSDTTNIKDARWIDYKFFSTINDIKISMRDGKYIDYKDEDIQGWAGKKDDRNVQDKKFREGVDIDEMSDELVLLHETCIWHDIDNDGIAERCIATWPDNNPTQLLRIIEVPYDHGQWPYVQVERELVDTGFYTSRGIPALDDDFQTGISASFNNDLANQLIVNTPFIKHLKGAVSNIRNRRYIPGEAVEVRDMNGYSMEQSVNASQGTFMVTQQQLKNWAQERIGNQSRSLSNSTNPQGGGQQGKKTAREVEEISFISSQSQSLDIMVFQNQMKDVYYQIDSLYFQFGQEEEFVMTSEQPEKVTRRDIQGRFNMSPTGKLENSNPIQRAQKSVLMLQSFRNDPDIKQDELKKFVIQDNYDVKTMKRLMISKEEKQQMQQFQIQMAEQQKAKAVNEATQVARLQSMTELEKEAGMAAIHGRKYAPDKNPNEKDEKPSK